MKKIILVLLLVFIISSCDQKSKVEKAVEEIPMEMKLHRFEQAFFDAIAERGNICCGILNRDLGHYFPHMGLSTPNILDKECSSKLEKK